MVLALGQQEEAGRCKELFDAAPEEARLTDELLGLVHFLKERTFCTWYEAVRAIIPYGAQYRPASTENGPRLQKQLQRHTEPLYELAGPLPEKPKPTEKQKAAAAALANGPLPASALAEMGLSRAVLDNLCEKGVLRKGQVDKTVDLYAGIPRSEEPVVLSDDQQRVFEGLAAQMAEQKPAAALLHGVTASGKTLVFLKLIQRCLELGRTALVLVPEISLTPQMIRRLKASFGERVAVQHSALSHTERLLQWRMIQTGGADIVVGTRSAVFAPLANIGLIVVDEEQEHTYQSENAPRFDARQVAKRRAADHNALVLFASATPSVESYQAALDGRYTLYKLTKRYASQPLPTVELVDMRAELAAGNPASISAPLAEHIRQTLAAKRQTILLLNRRGYRTVGMCTECGKAVKCGSFAACPWSTTRPSRNCSATTAATPSPRCPPDAPSAAASCATRDLALSGWRRSWPSCSRTPASCAWTDSTGQKNAHDRMLARFAAGDYDIMLGTQMVAKGLDFEKVTLVGVLGVDSLLFSQGFRAYENVFSLVTQVIGRGGRASEPGHAVIQTVDPQNPVLNLAASENYEAFFAQEIAFRKLCLYPPFCSVCIAAFSGEKDGETLAAAARFGALLTVRAKQQPNMPLRLLGPAPMNVVLIKDRYRYKLTIKCRNDKAFRALLADVMQDYSAEGLPGKAAVTLDFNSDGD